MHARDEVLPRKAVVLFERRRSAYAVRNDLSIRPALDVDNAVHSARARRAAYQWAFARSDYRVAPSRGAVDTAVLVAAPAAHALRELVNAEIAAPAAVFAELELVHHQRQAVEKSRRALVAHLRGIESLYVLAERGAAPYARRRHQPYRLARAAVHAPEVHEKRQRAERLYEHAREACCYHYLCDNAFLAQFLHAAKPLLVVAVSAYCLVYRRVCRLAVKHQPLYIRGETAADVAHAPYRLPQRQLAQVEVFHVLQVRHEQLRALACNVYARSRQVGYLAAVEKHRLAHDYLAPHAALAVGYAQFFLARVDVLEHLYRHYRVVAGYALAAAVEAYYSAVGALPLAALELQGLPRKLGRVGDVLQVVFRDPLAALAVLLVERFEVLEADLLRPLFHLIFRTLVRKGVAALSVNVLVWALARNEIVKRVLGNYLGFRRLLVVFGVYGLLLHILCLNFIGQISPSSYRQNGTPSSVNISAASAISGGRAAG